MNIFQLSIGIALAGNLALGGTVFLANSRRIVNQAFLILSSVIGVYLTCMEVKVHALKGLHTRESLEDAAHREERLRVRQADLLQAEPRWLDVSGSDARCAAP